MAKKPGCPGCLAEATEVIVSCAGSGVRFARCCDVIAMAGFSQRWMLDGLLEKYKFGT